MVLAFLHRIESVNSKLDAVVQLAADRALTKAREADKSLQRKTLMDHCMVYQ